MSQGYFVFQVPVYNSVVVKKLDYSSDLGKDILDDELWKFVVYISESYERQCNRTSHTKG